MKSGRLRALGVTSAKRSSATPDVPNPDGSGRARIPHNQAGVAAAMQYLVGNRAPTAAQRAAA